MKQLGDVKDGLVSSTSVYVAPRRKLLEEALYIINSSVTFSFIMFW